MRSASPPTREFPLRHVGVDEAKALQRALSVEGVNAALVKDEDLRFLPSSQLLHRIELTHDALVIHDMLGRTRCGGLGYIYAGGGGRGAHIEISSTQTPGIGMGFHPVFGIWPKKVMESRTRLETERHYVLELMTGPGGARYEIQAHQFPFKFVLDRPAASLTEKFVWLVREMTRRAP